MNRLPSADVTPQKYYRLPWSLTDNAVSWLEVTTKCNLACKGCYRDTRSSEGHKSLAEIAEDLAVFKANRKSDCMSVAGGDPLVHPEIVEIVRMIAAGGWKPVLNTNGLALTPELLGELKRAGVYGFTFHIDTSQKRGDAIGAKREADLNPLRLHFAEMLAKAGGIACSFNQTVAADTLDQVPEVMRWAVKHPDIVHTVVFILYREPIFFGDEFDYYAGAEPVPVANTYKRAETWRGDEPLRAGHVIHKIREVEPDFEPCGYLGGTANPTSTKWLFGMRVANKQRGFGYVSARFMEIVQQVHHAVNGTWLAYSKPETLSAGRSSALGMSLIDGGMRSIAGRFLANGLRRPAELLQKMHSQTFLIIQPIDLLADGRDDMCDGCPDMTVYRGKMYWSCRLEEVKEHGCFVRAVPKASAAQARRPPRAAAAARGRRAAARGMRGR